MHTSLYYNYTSIERAAPIAMYNSVYISQSEEYPAVLLHAGKEPR